jgi:hypothetical protein
VIRSKPVDPDRVWRVQLFESNKKFKKLLLFSDNMWCFSFPRHNALFFSSIHRIQPVKYFSLVCKIEIFLIKSEILKQSNLKFQSRLPFTYKIYFLIFSIKLKIVDLINQIICAELDHLLQLDHVAGNQDLLDVVLKQVQQKQ